MHNTVSTYSIGLCTHHYYYAEHLLEIASIEIASARPGYQPHYALTYHNLVFQ